MSNHKIGHLCEKAALLYLMLKGYLPVAMNVVTGRGTGAGEIDLIMRRGKTLVFVEVKKRSSYCRGVEAITGKNQMRVARASAVFLQRHPAYQGYDVRYDAVVCVPWQWPKHIKGAWRIL
ncbi:MAG: YraN family protein [Alphaproteobacteria bacterium]